MIFFLGTLPSFMLSDDLNYIIDSIINTTVITEPTSKWAESRRDALKALTMIISTQSVEQDTGKPKRIM